MTTRKITTFLMCPAANGDALGGTPAASAASGGHIKKSAGWVHLSDLILPALAEFGLSEEYNRRRAQHRVERQEDEATNEDGVDRRTVHNLSQDGKDTRVDEREEAQLGGGEGAGHGSDLGFNQLGPDRLPVAAEVLPRHSANRFALDHHAKRRAGLAVVLLCGKLLEVDRRDIDAPREVRNATARKAI